MTDDAVLYAVEGGVATLTLNRPDTLNAISLEVLDALEAGIRRVASDDKVRVAVIRGRGRAFSAGANLNFLQEIMLDLGVLVRFVERINDVLLQIEALHVPVVAVVHGYALAGGFELLLSADFVLVADEARMGDYAARYGLLSGAGATARLLRRVSYQSAVDLLMTAKAVTGKEAEAMGLVLRSVPADQLDAEVQELLKDLLAKSPAGLKYAKQAIRRALDAPLRQAIDEEMLAQLSYYLTSRNPRRGLEAFLAKKEPVFE